MCELESIGINVKKLCYTNKNKVLEQFRQTQLTIIKDIKRGLTERIIFQN